MPNLTIKQKEFLINFVGSHLNSNLSFITYYEEKTIKSKLYVYSIPFGGFEIQFSNTNQDFYREGHKISYIHYEDQNCARLTFDENYIFELLTFLIENDFNFQYNSADHEIFIKSRKFVFYVKNKKIFMNDQETSLKEIIKFLGSERWKN